MQSTQLQAFVFSTFGERLRFLRAINRLSARTVAERAKISISSLYAWESNKRSPKRNNVIKLSTVYDVPISWLDGDYRPHVEDPVFISVENTIGERVRFVRQLEGLSLEDAAHQLGVSAVELAITEAGFEPKIPFTHALSHLTSRRSSCKTISNRKIDKSRKVRARNRHLC